MDKERLEEIKKIMKDIKELHKKHDQRQADNAKCYLVEKYGDWIISTVEGQQKEIESYQMRYENTGSIFHRQYLQGLVEELKHEGRRLTDLLIESEKEINVYKQALEFYADEKNYKERDFGMIIQPAIQDGDRGRTARQALEESE